MLSFLYSRHRLWILFAALPVLLVVAATLYVHAMAFFEGEERTFWRALEWASETLTTTGYGADAQWTHPAMVIFVICMQFLGVFLVYMLVPLMLLPMLEDRFEMRLPRKAPKGLSDHVVIFRLGPAVETLIEELCDAGLSVLILELDERAARSFLEHAKDQGRRYRRVHLVFEGSVPYALEAARLDQARALVANGPDAENATAVLVARENGFEGPLLALAEEPNHRRPLLMAGADEVITPRLVLGEALAVRASLKIHPRVEGLELLDGRIGTAEIQVDPGSFLADKTLKSADLAQRTGATVIGQWVEGELEVETRAETRLRPQGILLAVGRPHELKALGALAQGTDGERGQGPLIVVGDGEVGKKVVELLRSVGEDVVVVDRNPEVDGVDVRGDIVDPEVLSGLDLGRAKGMVLALDTDASTLFAVLTVKGRAPDLPVVARVNLAKNIDRMYRAGADFALSISDVSAQMAARLLLGRDKVVLDVGLRLIRMQAGPFVGLKPSQLDIRRRASCSLVAVERDGELLSTHEGGLCFEADDTLYICGPSRSIERFPKLFGTVDKART